MFGLRFVWFTRLIVVTLFGWLRLPRRLLLILRSTRWFDSVVIVAVPVVVPRFRVCSTVVTRLHVGALV